MKLFVGNLPFSVSEDQLKEIFEKYGEIKSLKLITDRETGRSRGFGFVTFKEDKSAENAIKDMHDKGVEGRNLVVKEAMPLGERTERKPSEERGGDRTERPERGPKKEHTRHIKHEEKSDEEF